MLNLFPIMWLSLLAHAILRVAVGSILIYLGVRHATGERRSLSAMLPRTLVWLLASAELIVGAFFFAGALTQAAALAGVALAAVGIAFRRRLAHPAIPGLLFYLMLGAASLSLFITGAGALAIDLPI